MRKGSETKQFLHVRKGRDTSITWTQSPQFTEWKGEEKEIMQAERDWDGARGFESCGYLMLHLGPGFTLSDL